MIRAERILGQITLHGRQFRIVDNRRMKTDRLCLEWNENGFWTRVCRFGTMDDLLWWLRLYELGAVTGYGCAEYQKSVKRRKPSEET